MVVGPSQEYNGPMVTYVPKYLRVYLLDDHDIVRQGLRDLLVPAIDIYVVGDSGSAREATRVIPGLGIDVMVLDLRLQDGTGIDVCRAARAADPSVRGLLLTSSGDDEALTAAILAGAAGYVVKLTRSSDITEAIRRVGAGKSLIDPGHARTRQPTTVGGHRRAAAPPERARAAGSRWGDRGTDGRADR